MRLGELIDLLEAHDADKPLRYAPVGSGVVGLGENPGDFDSYRG